TGWASMGTGLAISKAGGRGNIVVYEPSLPSNEKPDVYTHELFRSKIKGPAHGSTSRGYDRRSQVHQEVLQRALRWLGKSGPRPISIKDLDLGHAGKPHSTLAPGEQSTLKGQLASENRSIGA